MKKRRSLYLLILIIVLITSIIGSTYAYLTAKVESAANSISTSSSTYSLSMNITPIYNDFRVIPMNDTDIIKALKNKCKDKYNRGACSLYKINIDGYDTKLKTLTGKMDVELINIVNLSYMFFEEKDEVINEDRCISVDEKIYCISKEATPVLEGKNLDLGSYNIENSTEKNFLLALWLTNLEESQNNYDLGDYNAKITFSMGDGGSITGNIAASIGKEEELQSQSGE